MNDKEKTGIAERVASGIRMITGTLAAVHPEYGWFLPILGEVLTSTIPQQRIDRLNRLTEELAEQVKDMDEARVKQRFEEPGFVDLLEDGLIQATRATSQERINHIACVLKNGLADEDAEAIPYKKLLSLLGQLNDVEVIVLQSCQSVYAYNSFEFYEKHRGVLTPPLPKSINDPTPPDEEAIYTSYSNQLLILGLIKNHFRRLGADEVPDFDYSSGTFRSDRTEITDLGNLLLRVIGASSNEEQEAD